MTDLGAFLAELQRLDIRLALDGDRLRVDAPGSAITADLRAELARRKPELVAHLRGPSAPAEGAAGGEPGPSPGQRRLWALAKAKANGSAYHVPTAFRLKGPLDVSALEAALADLERRHEPLRTTFRDTGSTLASVVGDPRPFVLPIVDLGARHAGGGALDEAILREIRDDVRAPFDLAVDRPWRARLLKAGADDHVLVLVMHHIAFDGRSKPIYLAELAEAYRARTAGRPPAFAPLPARYSDFAAWQHAEATAAEARGLATWRARLRGVEALELPRDRPRPDIASRGARSLAFELPLPLAKSLRAYARQEQSSPFAVLLAALAALLHGRTGQEDIVVCAPFASRDRVAFEGLVGYLNTIVPLRVDATGDPAFHALVARVRGTMLEAFEHQQVPLERLATLPETVQVPLTRALLSFQDASTRTLDLAGVEATPVDLRKAGSDFDLALYAEGLRDGGVGGIVEYDADQFDDATIAALLRDLERLLGAALDDPHRAIGALPASVPGPSAVEARLQSHRQIDRAVVGRRAGHAGTIAWMVLNEHDVPRLEDVRAFLRSAFPAWLVPTALVTVDRMPLLPDGGIDRAALPDPPALRNRAGTPYVAPRTPLERRLARVWQRVLWLDTEVGVDDRFQDLGGHSLLSAQLVVELERELGRRLPTSVLAELSTVAAMARTLEAHASQASTVPDSETAGGPGDLPAILDRIRGYVASWAGERASPDSLVIGRNVAGAGTPLFWCLQREQELSQLARYLGPSQPVYGMRSGNRVMEKSPENIASLAGRYADEIVALRPEGPLVVGGNCQAARIAFDIARSLAARGRAPALLILHEMFVRQRYSGPVALMFGRESDRNPYLQFRRPEIGWRKFYSGPVSFDLVSGAHSEFFVEPNVQVLTDTLRRRIADLARAPRPVEPGSGGLQMLRPEACRVRLAARVPPSAIAGAKFQVEVEVTNDSPVPWQAFEQSGIALVNRWFDDARNEIAWLDGWTPLPRGLRPADSVRLVLEATAPVDPGRYQIAFDLVDEGVATFNARGSKLLFVPIGVDGAGAGTDYNAAPSGAAGA